MDQKKMRKSVIRICLKQVMSLRLIKRSASTNDEYNVMNFRLLILKEIIKYLSKKSSFCLICL